MKILCLFTMLLPALLVGDFFTAQVRVGDFCPNNKKTREIYSANNLDLEVESSLKYCQNSAVWGNINYVTRDGHLNESDSYDAKTTVKFYPISVGYKTLYPLGSCFTAYMGAGLSYSYVKIEEKSESIKEHWNKEAWGTVVKAGVNCALCDYLFADLFFDYYYTKVKFEHHKFNLGGFRTGIGLGICF